MNLKNWAGNLTYGANRILEPATVEAVQQFVLENKLIRALGTKHCFNRIADSDDAIISTRNLNKIVSLDADARTVTVEAGIRYGELCQHINSAGFAIHNLASLPHISVAGACATATHGSGMKNGNLATAVSALEIVNAKGEVVSLSREKDKERFYGAVVGLGSLGLVTKMTLDLVPAFLVRQDIYLDLPMSQLDNHFDEIMSAGYSVSLFTDWQTENINQVWIKRVTQAGDNIKVDPDFFGATAATKNVHPIIDVSAENCTDQMGVPGLWHERLPHFKLNFTPSSGEELQAEYFIPTKYAVDAIRAVQTLKSEIRPYLMISEIRTIDADNFWMSPCYKQSSVAIHFTLKQDVKGVNALLPKIESKLEPFGVRPHWGKLFTLSPSTLQSRYERITDFQKLMKDFDPEGKFINEFISINVMPVSKS